MSYEVVKRIRGRDYRYLVESYRDPETGKVRNAWRYLGKAGGAPAARRRAGAGETRSRVVRALEDLLRRESWSRITARRIAAQAGVAPATLYRYFSSREDVLTAAAICANDRLEARLTDLQRVAGDRENERARLRAWVIAVVKDAPRSPVPAAFAGDGHAQHRRAFERYFELLAAHGHVTLAHRERPGLALTLSQIVGTQWRLRDEEYAALAGAVERLIFA